MLVNVRDPIDRFLSGVAWRKSLACGHPDHETRKPTLHAGSSPTTLCEKRGPMSKAFAKIHWNASALAEGLCPAAEKCGRVSQEFSFRGAKS